MSGAFDGLPALLAEIAEVVGLEAALRIAEARGGAYAYFPARARDDHWLVALIGREAADALCRHFRSGAEGAAGIELEIPLGPRNFYATARRRAEELRRQNMPEREIARRLGITYRSVKRYKARARTAGGGSGQGELF